MFTNGEFKRVLGVLAVTLTFSGGAGRCQSINPRRYTQEEELILRRVADGKIAKFGDLPVEKRTVPADFLAQLLTGKVRGASISNEGVLIEHAVIKGRLSVAARRYIILLGLTTAISRAAPTCSSPKSHPCHE